MAEKVQIVLARKVEDARVIESGRRDLGESPKFETFQSPKSCMWLKRGGPADIAKAQAFAEREGYRVFTYPTSLRDSLEQAKRDIMAN